VAGMAALVSTAAAIHDLKWRRIPNWLTGAALIAGLVVNVWLGGANGALTALTGAAVGLALLLPIYAVRGLGAGDVKLLAAVGAILGPQNVLLVALYGALIGGLMSLAQLAIRGRLLPMLQQALILRMRPSASGLKAPYGLAIAGGVYLAFLAGSIG